MVPTRKNSQRCSKILVAVSGGIDSMVLLHKLFMEGEPIAAAHVNFKLRGADSNADQQFVKDWCSAHKIPFFTACFETSEYARSNGISIEMAARQLRYEWFYKTAAEHGFTHLATAHNANDNAETLLLNLVRGTGIKGLKGIAARREIELPENGHKVILIRPLLAMQRSDIEQYARENGVPFREDKTNKESIYSRNKIRNQVVPVLESINPGVVATLNRNIEHFSQAFQIVEKESAKIESQISERPQLFDYLGLRAKYLVACFSVARLRKIEDYSFWLGVILSARYGCSYSLIGEINAVIGKDKITQMHSVGVKNEDSTRFFYSDKYTLSAERGYIKIYEFDPEQFPLEVQIEKEGRVQFGALHIETEIIYARQDKSSQQLHAGILKNSHDSNEASSPNIPLKRVLYIAADKLSFPLICRRVQSGDRFSPYGLKGSKPVADFLNDKKIDTIFKKIIPAITCNDKIVCMAGIEISDDYKVTASTQTILKLSVS